jgi:hypothetical protein
MKSKLNVWAKITADYQKFKNFAMKSKSKSTSKSAIKKAENKQYPIRTWNSQYQGTAYRDGKGWYQNVPMK